MEKVAFINNISAYLPNSPIANEDMEDYIGKIGGNQSRVRSIVLRQNGIKTRYYGLDKNQSLTRSNAELAKEAVCGLFEDEKCKDCEFIPICMGGCAFYRIKNMFDNGNFDICSLYKDNGVIEKCICLHLDKLRIKTPSI